MTDFAFTQYTKSITISYPDCEKETPEWRERWTDYRDMKRRIREARERQHIMLTHGLFSGGPVYFHGDKIF